jgi:hypothetical protein
MQRTVGNQVVRRVLGPATRTVQRMPHQNALGDRILVYPQLLVTSLTRGEIDTLFQQVGATTVRQVGIDLVVSLRQASTLPQTIAIIQQLSQAKLAALDAVRRDRPAELVQFVALPPADISLLLSPVVSGRGPGETAHLANALMPGGLTAFDVHALASLPRQLTPDQIVYLQTRLHPLPIAQIMSLVTALHADGLAGDDLVDLVGKLSGAGRTGAQIEQDVNDLRGNLLNPLNPQDPSARPVTSVPPVATVPGPPPVVAPVGGVVVAPAAPIHGAPAPLPPQQQPGTKVLSGPEIYQHLTATTVAGRAAPSITGAYPTGQTLAARNDNQLWDDCIVNGAGALFLPNVTVGQPPETAPQRSIRQKMALAELRRRHAAQAGIVQSIFSHDEGATPRQFVSIANDDTYNVNAHNTSRHVLGGANMQNIESLAWRAISKVPHCGASASAFNNVGEADNAVQGALNAVGFANAPYWPALRANLIGGVLPPQILQASNLGVVLRKTDPPRGAAYAPLPPAGPPRPRPLIDPGGAVPLAAAGPAAGAPSGYTHQVTVTQVTVRIQRSDNQAGHGWCVYTTYPSP